MSARPTTPPATPPAIAAVLDELDLEEDPPGAETEVAAPAAALEVDALATVAVPFATEVETALPPITEPASTSGESVMKKLRCKLTRRGRVRLLTTNSECRGGIPETQGL